MTRWVTETVPVNIYGDMRETSYNADWQSDYAKYLQENNLVLDAAGNPVKKGERNELTNS
jgi:heat shock protein HspQ